jgi:hypothetical protein
MKLQFIAFALLSLYISVPINDINRINKSSGIENNDLGSIEDSNVGMDEFSDIGNDDLDSTEDSNAENDESYDNGNIEDSSAENYNVGESDNDAKATDGEGNSFNESKREQTEGEYLESIQVNNFI